MTFLALILTNLRRHRVRSLIGMAGIAFGVAAMLSVITLLQGAIHMFERILARDSEIIVFERNVSDLFFSSVPVKDLQTIETWEAVAHVDPMLFGIVSSPDNPVITCFGVEPADSRLRTAKWIAGTSNVFTREARGVVLGERAAGFLKASVGNPVSIGKESYPVLGIIRSANGFEDGGVFMPLALAQDFFHRDGVVSIATIKLRNADQKAQFKEQVKHRFTGLIALENEEFSRTYSQFRILKNTAWAVGGCAFLLGGLSVANTMIMSVFTRIREIAILRVCGFSRFQVAGLIFGESALISVAGMAIGLIFSQLAMHTLRRLPLLQGYIETELEPSSVVTVVALAVGASILGALYPAGYGVKIRAAEALRFE